MTTCYLSRYFTASFSEYFVAIGPKIVPLRATAYGQHKSWTAVKGQLATQRFRAESKKAIARTLPAGPINSSPGAEATARFEAVSIIQRFTGALKAHIQFHCCVIDGVFFFTVQGSR
jgi:hypothetical protein